MTSTPQRRTRQGTVIVDALAGLDEFKTAQDIHDLLRARGEKIGLATVYRHLQSLTDAGEVDVIRTDDGQASYRACGEATHDHHHHLICRSCGRTVEVELPGVEELIDALAATHGYTGVDHSLELRGLCAACSAA